MTQKERILALKKEKNAVILAHFYQPLEIQLLADIVGDSLELARKSKNVDAEKIIFCGVRFMGESAAIICPDKRVFLPAPDAGCLMADMIKPEDIEALRAKYPNSAVVCYINSTAETKAHCDICCTSSNAVKVVNSLSEDEVIFVPDKNLGSYVASMTPNKKFHFFDGCCPIHHGLSVKSVLNCKEEHPDAAVLVHPECSPEVCALADFAGSTAQILTYCENSENDEFIICTEIGVTERMSHLMPNKTFYIPDRVQLFCNGMKEITLDMLENCLENETGEVFVDKDMQERALLPIERMLKI